MSYGHGCACVKISICEGDVRNKNVQSATESARPAAHVGKAANVLEQVWIVLRRRDCTVEVDRLVRHSVLSHDFSARRGCNCQWWMTTTSHCTWCISQHRQPSSSKLQDAIAFLYTLTQVLIITAQGLRPTLDVSSCRPAGINTLRPSVRLR